MAVSSPVPRPARRVPRPRTGTPAADDTATLSRRVADGGRARTGKV